MNSSECACYQNILMFFLYTKFVDLIINNEYTPMVFTIRLGRLSYSNIGNIREYECTYGAYGSYCGYV